MDNNQSSTPRPRIIGRLHQRSKQRRGVWLSLSEFFDPPIVIKLIRSYARVLVLVVKAFRLDRGMPEELRGFRSYDELQERLELFTGWPVERQTVIAMLSRIHRLVEAACQSRGMPTISLFERDGGAVRLAPALEFELDAALFNELLDDSDGLGDMKMLSTAVQEIFKSRQLSADEQLIVRREFVAQLRDQFAKRSGPLYELAQSVSRNERM